jgi:WD40 repeat protein
LQYSLEAGEAALNIVFAPGGKTVLAAGGVWDVITGQLTTPLEREGVAAISPDGELLASGGCSQYMGDHRAQHCVEGRIIIWDAETGQPLRSTAAHSGEVRWIQFLGNGAELVTVGGDTVEWREAETGDLMRTLTFHTAANSGLVPFALSPDGRVLAWGDGNEAQVWDANTGEALATLEGHRAVITDVVFSSDGRLLASSSDDGTIRVWAAKWP